MSDSVYCQTVKVVNPQGFHLRPAQQLVESAATFVSRIELVKNDTRIDIESNILGVLAMGVGEGDEISIEGFGDDARQAVDALVKLVKSGFGILANSELEKS